LKPDFSYADFLFFMPKLLIMLMGEFGNLSMQEQANQTTAGYHHTYFKTDDLDLDALMTWVSNTELKAISTVAAKEAISLLGAVGISITDYLSSPVHHFTSAPLSPEASDPVDTPLKELVAAPCHDPFTHVQLYKAAPLQPAKTDLAFNKGMYALVAEEMDATLAMYVRHSYSLFPALIYLTHPATTCPPNSTDKSLEELHTTLAEPNLTSTVCSRDILLAKVCQAVHLVFAFGSQHLCIHRIFLPQLSRCLNWSRMDNLTTLP
jgi:hypothetical protein